MTGSKSIATLSIGDDAVELTLSGSYELWEDDEKFEELIEQLRTKRKAVLNLRREGL